MPLPFALFTLLERILQNPRVQGLPLYDRLSEPYLNKKETLLYSTYMRF